MKRLGLVALLVVAMLAGGGAWFGHRVLYTPQGLQWLLRQLSHIPGLQVQASGVRGVLAGPLAIDHIVVDHDAVHVDARGLRADPELRGLWLGTVLVEDVDVAKIAVRLKHREHPGTGETHFLPAWLRLSIPEAVAHDIDLTFVDGGVFHLRRATGSVRLSRWRLDLKPCTVEDGVGSISGEFYLRATTPLGLRGSAAGYWLLPDRRVYRFDVRAAGNLDRLGADLTLQQPARLSFAGTLLELTTKPHAVGAVRAIDFDGSPWVPAGQLPVLNGSAAIVASPTAIGLDGTFTSPALEGGPLRLQGAARWHEHQIEIGSLRAWLPRSKFAVTTRGTVTFGGEHPQLALQGDWTEFRWPLGGEVLVASAFGAYTLDGALPYTFQVKGDARGPSFPDVMLDATGTLDTEQLVLQRASGDTLRGTVQASGRLSWIGGQPWRFEVVGRGLDVSRLRPEVPGRINVNASIEGRGLASTAPWTARIASLSGTLFNRSLTGRGEISHRDGTFVLRDLRAMNGASRVIVNGTVGSTLDLRWDADLQSLAIVTPGLAGALVSSGYAKGTLRQPQLNGEAHLRDVRYGDVVVQRADAVLDVDASDRHASRVDTRATGVQVGTVRLDTVALRASGLTREHAIDLELVSPGSEDKRFTAFRGAIGVNGHYDATRGEWSGNLSEATFTFPDGQAHLLQPAALLFGPNQRSVAPICIAAEEARLCIEGQQQAQPASWRVIYSAQDWPLRRVLRSLMGRQEFDGKLQASGWAEQSPGHDWVGGTTLLVDQPSLAIPRNKFRSERFDLGSARLDFYAEPDRLRTEASLVIEDKTEIRGQVVAERRPGRDLLASPVQGTFHGESATMKELALLVPEIDRSSGRLEADAQITGTLGEPQFNGEFHVRDGRFDMYRTNLVMSKCDLDGRFVGDELQFAGQGETSKGKVAIDGRFAWPGGIMTGAMHLRGEQLLVADTPEYRVIASPNLTLKAGKDGYEAEGEIFVPSARISPKDLSTTVSTSPDERIVGIELEDTGPSTVERVRSRIKVRLGENVRVDSYGLKAKLGGEVLVLTEPGDVARGNGSINIVEGQYKAFGQDVKITRGRLSYNHTPLGEPVLDLTAERTIKDEDVTVTVNVRGTLARPYVTVTSNPAMSSNEALSYLITGRSIDTLQSGEATSVNKAAENLALSGGGFLLGGIGSKLGLDEVTVARTDTDDTAVTVGKFLSPKLFVSYGVSIAEAINTIKLRYTLNNRWSVKAEAGLEQSADFEYKIER